MGPDLNDLMRLDKSQLKPAAAMMARAFHDNPGSVYFFPDVSQRKSKLPHLFRLLVRYGLLYGEVYATSPKLEGVAVWLPSEKSYRTLWRNIRSGGLFLLFKAGRAAAAREYALGEYFESMRQRCAPAAYWYLLLLGVDPVYQGKGYASILLRAMLVRVGQERLPCYLETLTEKDVSIYRHLGFEVVEEGVVPGTGVTVRAMLRKND
jgi:ribosomal protein S18 acetylase RimI-like enzyme